MDSLPSGSPGPVRRHASGKSNQSTNLVSTILSSISKTANSGSSTTSTPSLLFTDVSALSSRSVCRVVTPRTESQLIEIVAWCRTHGKRLVVAGAAHTMGEQTLLDDAVLLQTKFLDSVTYDTKTHTVTAGSGAKWSTVIRTLNYYGRTPRTLQSYCSFSVGGSVGANVHGITSDESISESIVSVRILLADGTIIPDVTLQGPMRELFKATLGGYGTTGIILTATFTTEPNAPIQTEVIPIDRESQDFIPIYQRLRHDASIVTKIVRVNISKLDSCTLYLFRRTNSDSRQSNLPFVPSENMPLWKSLAYSLLFHRRAFQTLRYKLEAWTQVPVDWSAQPEKNKLLYETAAPLAKLYQPFFLGGGGGGGTSGARKKLESFLSNAGDGRLRGKQSDTFLLKEYFIPESNFVEWWKKMQDLVEKSRASLEKKHVHLLNITLRSVRANEDSYLSYSPLRSNGGKSSSKMNGSTTNQNGENNTVPAGSCTSTDSALVSPSSTPQSQVHFDTVADELHYVAAVFYFRLSRFHADSEPALNGLDRQLIDLSLDQKGTFYLPYRISYTQKQLERAYPSLKNGEFLDVKNKFDPSGLFVSEWYIRVLELTGRTGEAKRLREPMEKSDEFTHLLSPSNQNYSNGSSTGKKGVIQQQYTFRPRPTNLFTSLINSFTVGLDSLGTDSYARNAELSDRLETFLKFVLPVEKDSGKLKSILSKAALYYHAKSLKKDPLATTPKTLDEEIYTRLLEYFQGSQYARAKSAITSLRILSSTRSQVGGEMCELLSLLPDRARRGIHSLACIGDHGRYMNILLSILPGLREIHKIHDSENHWLTRIESGAIFLPGMLRSHLIDYQAIEKSLSGSATLPLTQRFDFLIMPQGLHHLSSTNLDAFLRFVYSRLNPGGYFLIREHDAGNPMITQMADFAHVLFNASTGVEWEEEESEIRNFQSVETWKKVLESYGFQDTFLANRQETDSTEDHMLLFQKPHEVKDLVDMYERRSSLMAIRQVNGNSNHVSADQLLAQPMVDGHTSNGFSHGGSSGSKSKNATAAAASSSSSAVVSASSDSSSPSSRNPIDTLFMPAEWMVVDSIAHLRDFLSEQPWYRFPFFTELKHVWLLFWMSCRASQQRHGFKSTVTNSIFSSNLMACMFTSYIYIQVGIFALLLRLVLGAEYAASNVMKVGYTRGSEAFKAQVDRYVVFSDFLYDTANEKPTMKGASPVTFTSINGPSCKELLVKIDWLLSGSGGKEVVLPSLGVPVLRTILVPAFTTKQPSYTSATYRVPIEELATFLRSCAAQKDKIRDGKPFVYDF